MYLDRVILVGLLWLFCQEVGGVPPCPAGSDVDVWINASCLLIPRGGGSDTIIIRGYHNGTYEPLHNLGGFPKLYSAANTAGQPDGSVAGLTKLLRVRRVVLMNFTVSTPVNALDRPLLWPTQLSVNPPGPGSQLEMADVRILVSRPLMFDCISIMLADPEADAYTDHASFLHITKWIKPGVQLLGVTLVAVDCAGSMGMDAPRGLAASRNQLQNCSSFIAPTNESLIPAVLQQAPEKTTVPLAIFLTQNVTLGHFYTLVNRPAYFIGLVTRPTSIDFHMVVNQMNLTGSENGMVYFVSTVMENVAHGDIVTGYVATPFSVLIVNNIYPVYFNRNGPIRVRMSNTTLVVPQPEIDYMVYMLTMYASPLPFLKNQTDFLRVDLNLTSYDYVPGPGSDITVTRSESKARGWRDLIITTQPRVATPLPMPPAPAGVLAANKPGALVVNADSAQELEATVKQRTTEFQTGRDHVVMVTGSLDLSPNGSSWPPPGGLTIALPASIIGTTNGSAVVCGYAHPLLVLPDNASASHLQIRQVQLVALPQGDAEQQGHRRLLGDGPGGLSPSEWTLLLWFVERPMTGTSLVLDGVELLLPVPEFIFIKDHVEGSTSPLIALSGDGQDIAIRNAVLQNGSIKVQRLLAPGLEGTNLLLTPDPEAVASMPGGYRWSGADATAPAGGGHSNTPSWVIAVAVVVGALCAAAVGACILLAWRSKRTRRQQSAVGGNCPTCDEEPCICSEQRHTVMPLNQDLSRDLLGDLEGHIIIPHRIAGDAPAGLASVSGLSKANKQQLAASGEPCQHAAASDQPAGVSSSQSGSTGVSTGLSNWWRAVSSTMLTLMERRHDAGGGSGAEGGSGDTSSHSQQALGIVNLEDAARAGGVISLGGPGRPSVAVVLEDVLGRGSFGTVYKGAWHGKAVAVKIMHFPAGALLNVEDASSVMGLSNADPLQRQHVPYGRVPEMGLMEAVVSSAMCHPNVVQVYTYMMDPLSVSSTSSDAQQYPTPDSSGATSRRTGGQAGQGEVAEAGRHLMVGGEAKQITGWELKIVMEYCNGGSLRDALDRCLLYGVGGWPLPALVLSLAHDVASALLHLHEGGIVHGDIKAANVLLTGTGATDLPAGRAQWKSITAKVADFGLALLLGPADTHATHNSRGTPTHMAPELLLHGHVSKASDVYAFGILLWELMTGRRAFAGVPIALLPHEVAMKELRPAWPEGLPDSPGYTQLRALAEDCWVAAPAERPSLAHAFARLEEMSGGHHDTTQHGGDQGTQVMDSGEQEQQHRPMGSGSRNQGSSWSEVF